MLEIGRTAPSASEVEFGVAVAHRSREVGPSVLSLAFPLRLGFRLRLDVEVEPSAFYE